MSARHGNTTGEPGRAASRGFENLSFYPVIGLLVGIIVVGLAAIMLVQGGARDPEVLDRQFTLLDERLAADLRAFGLPAAEILPSRDAWTHRTFGDQDEWTATLTYSLNGEAVEDRIRIHFNTETTGYELRKDDWLVFMETDSSTTGSGADPSG